MDIESLRARTKEALGTKGKQLTIRLSSANSFLSPDSPALVQVRATGFEILVLSNLNSKEREEAEAHELAHLLLKCNGLICFDGSSDPEGFFRLELNNALSHRILVQMLESEFGISSATHLRLRKASLGSFKKDIDDFQGEPPILQGLGLRLFDIEQTVAGVEKAIQSIASYNAHVERALKGARTMISNVDHNMSMQDQLELCQDLVNSLPAHRQELSYFVLGL